MKADLNTFTLCIGSNIPLREDAIHFALKSLNTVTSNLIRSEIYGCPSYNGIGADYLNTVVSGSTAFSLSEFHQYLTTLENKCGRTPLSKSTGIMPLDVDIVIWNGEVIRPADSRSPHFLQGYSQISTAPI